MSRVAVDRAASPRSLLLWFGVLGPPAAWATHLVLGDLVFELGCGPTVRGRDLFGVSLETWGFVQTAALLLVAIGAGIAALVALRRLRRAPSDDPRTGRAHAMAIAGIASAFLFGLIILFGALAPALLEGCVPSP